MLLSIGIPLYNEAGNIAPLIARLREAVEGLDGVEHEIILVDDGSRDDTARLCTELSQADPRIKFIGLSRNFGHQAALTAALDHAQGDALVLMDGDLQDPPEAIPDLVARFRDGYDVVYAIRANRPENAFKRACYDICYKVIRYAAERPIPEQTGDFGLMSRRVVDHLKNATERTRYLRGMRDWVGFAQVGIEVERGARLSGEPKYSFSALVKLALDGLFSFSSIPIRLAWLSGAATCALTMLYAMYAVAKKLVFGAVPEGFTATIVLLAFIGGTQLFFLGILGEYVTRIYTEVRRRPAYIIDYRRSVGIDGP